MSVISDIHKDLEEGAIRLIAEHRDCLFAEAVRMCKDASTAEDLVSRTFAKAIQKIDSHDESRSLAAWLKTIMQNLYRNDMKRPVVRGTDPIDPAELERMDLTDWSSDEQLLKNSDSEALREAIGRLDPKFKQVLVMHYFSELPVKAIASALNMPVGTVLWRLNIARKILAKDLAEKLGRKPLALLAVLFLGVATLFGAWQAGEAIIEAMKPPSTENNQIPLTTTKEKSKMNTLKRITLAATAAASVMSMSAPAEVPEPKPTDYGWTRTYTQDGRDFVVTAYTNPGSGYEFKVPDGISAIDYLVVGGGGSGGTSYSAGGGGAGGYLEENGVAVTGGSVLSITVGAGGASGTGNGNNGGNSSIEGMAEALGGGAGGGDSSSGTSGGSGGGGSGWALTWGNGYGVLPLPTTAGSAGTAGQGYAGGDGHSTGVENGGNREWLIEYGGGGGGAGGVGGAEGSPADFAKYMVGGAGKVSSITGEEAEYARGGNGSSYNFANGTTPSIPAPIGPGNGSSAGSGSPSAAGCDGIVIIRYELKKNVSIKVTPNAGYQVSLDNETFVDSIDDDLPSGDSVTVYAKGASEEVAFAWTGLPNGAVVSTDTKSATFTMPGEAVDISVVGTVTTMYTLTVTVGSTECGVVTGTANGKYILGYPVALTATANENCVFVGWTVNGADEGNNPTLAFELTADTTVLATFREKAKYRLTVVGSDYGTITGGEAVEYFEGDKVTLTATPNEGLVFVGWDDDAASFGNAPSIELTMDAAKTVSAKFGYTLTITGSPYGTIASNPSGDAFAVGEQVTLTATPNEGCEFLEWAGDATGTEPTTTVTIDAAKTVSAAFKDAGGKAHYTWGWTSEIKNAKGRVTGYVTAFTQVGNHTFTVPNGIKEIDYLVVGGGGSGGASSAYNAAGGGGAGGFIEASGVSVKSGTELSITIGAGGAKNGNNGASSLLAGLADDPIEAFGGGAGGNDGQVGADGASGGGAGGVVSGWGAGYGKLPLPTVAGGNGTQGCAGGAGYSSGANSDDGKEKLFSYGGGGGGAGGAGGNGWTENDFPDNTDYILQGGVGKVSAITGEEVEYARGGNGSIYCFAGGTYPSTTPVGPGNGSSLGAAGCDGIVIIRYAPRKPGIMIMLY